MIDVEWPQLKRGHGSPEAAAALDNLFYVYLSIQPVTDKEKFVMESSVNSFKDIRGGVYVDALPEADFTAKALLENLPAGQDIFYRIRFQDLASPTIVGEPMVGRFRTAQANRRELEIHFLFFSFTARVWTALLITAVLSILAAELVGRHLRRRRDR